MLTVISKDWNIFFIGNLFSVDRPATRKKQDYDSGDSPFVASGSINNGVFEFYAKHEDEDMDKKNCLTVSPVDGSTFYQPMDFLGRGGAGSAILILRNSDFLNKYNGQFLSRCIAHTCSKYTYGHMGNSESIKREHILLPVTSSGTPDYEYMEQYVKNLMIRKYTQYLDYLDRRETL